MISPKEIYKQIYQLTIDIINSALCNHQNFPSIKSLPNGVIEVGINSIEKSIFLKNISYSQLYYELLEQKFYNIRMLDGGLITLQYKFKNNELIAHRLTFFPSPDLEIFQNEAEFYLKDEIYLDILDKKIVGVPLRFDFDSGEAFIPIKHPKSHLTLGQYEKCRIPVSSALTPYQFVEFILRNFYFVASDKKECALTKYSNVFEKSIVQEEKKLIHICIPS